MKINWWWVVGLFGAGAIMVTTGTLITLPATKREFISKMLQALGAIPGLSMQTKMLIIAHAAYESNWGKSTMAKYHNMWNLVGGKGTYWPVEKTVQSGDKQYNADGSVIRIMQPFRVYSSLEEACRDYLKFLSIGRHLSAYTQLMAGDAGFAYTLRATHEGGTGFYTLPSNEYWSSFSSILRDAVNGTREVYANPTLPAPRNATA